MYASVLPTAPSRQMIQSWHHPSSSSLSYPQLEEKIDLDDPPSTRPRVHCFLFSRHQQQCHWQGPYSSPTNLWHCMTQFQHNGWWQSEHSYQSLTVAWPLKGICQDVEPWFSLQKIYQWPLGKETLPQGWPRYPWASQTWWCRQLDPYQNQPWPNQYLLLHTPPAQQQTCGGWRIAAIFHWQSWWRSAQNHCIQRSQIQQYQGQQWS